MRNLTAKLFLLGIVLALSVHLKAQDVASITGVVTDQTGAVLPVVSVTLVNTATDATYKTETNSVGSYTLNQVKPGPGYKITFMHDGFKPFVVTGLYLNVDATRTQNARLTVGSKAETVEVSAANDNVTLNTTDATIGNSFQVQDINDLPIQNRSNPSALFYQQPGVTLDGAVTGARVDQTNVTLDGLDVNDNATGQFGNIVANAPVDSVQEFRGVTAGLLSSGGQGGGGQFELVTRSGTNVFHGALVEYHRDTDLEANDWFNNNVGTGRPPLIRNQFGGNVGGPILKNKAFFFFDYNGRKDTLTSLVARTVPIGCDPSDAPTGACPSTNNAPGYREGYLSYVNGSNAIEQLTPADVASQFDPMTKGPNQSLLALFKARIPLANDFTGDVGDLVNTAGFRFNAPFALSESDYVQKIDYTLNDKMKVYGRGTFTRTSATQAAVLYPGDPLTYPFVDQSYSWVVGHNWTISDTKVNQASFGETFENYQFTVAYNPMGINQYGFGGLSGAYPAGNNAQTRTYPIPILRDDFSWEKGKHSLTFGGEFKWETPNEFADENYNFPTVGLGGYTTALDPTLRPADLANDQYLTTIYDTALTTILAPFTQVYSNFNYDVKGVAQPQASGLDLIYRSYETELYVGDTWKLTPQITISYGLRYQNYTVPYEIHGKESVPSLSTGGPLSFDKYFGARLAQSAAGDSSNTDVPFIQYSLGGKADSAPGYYQPSNKNFAPRIAVAYSPSYLRKTVFNAGAGIVYDHTVVNALQFQLLQASYLFENNNINLMLPAPPVATTNSAAYNALATYTRFGGIDTPPTPPSPPDVTPPYLPFVTGTGASATPNGLANGLGNIALDSNFKTPYSITFNVGIEHEFPQKYILKASYVGRQARRLLAEADASQLIDFPDTSGGQMMSAAMAGMTTQLRQNASMGALNDILSLDPQPWFEDIVAPGVGAYYGFANNTQFIAYNIYPYPQRGDFSDTIWKLAQFGLLPPNIGMASQFAYNTVWTNKGSSGYNGLLLTLHKNAGYGLEFDLNYTWSHSIDNVSLGANNLAQNLGFGFICDVVRPRECRGNSDFDQAQVFNGNFIYDLPIGRNKPFASTVPFWLNEFIGDWKISGLPSRHTGNPYNATSNAYVAGFVNNAPATLIGSIGLLKAKISGGKGASLNAFANPASALGAFTGPTGFNIGSRNNLRGPGFFTIDLGVGKTFQVYKDKVNLKFRADAFNATNHPNFALPNTDITEASGIPFGTISSTVVPPDSDLAARVLQGSLRLEF
jgi:hypothetical protein